MQHECYFDSKEAEKLNETINAGMIASETKCCIFYPILWDKETHEVVVSKNIVKILLFELSHNIGFCEVLDIKITKLKEAFDFPITFNKYNKLLWTIHRQEFNLIKSWRVNQATTYQAFEQEFVTSHKITTQQCSEN